MRFALASIATDGCATLPGASGPSIGRGDRVALGTLLTATFLLRIVCLAHARIDSDEPQHLHVVWAWTQGLLPYRDVFDNHMPLFQVLCAPLLHLVGEQPRAVVAMRAAMVPLFAVMLAAVHRIARATFDARAAGWAVLGAALVPTFFFCSLEFRTDDLWAALWLVALAVAVGGAATPRRAALVGLLVGAALGASLKTILMLIALGGAVPGVPGLMRDRRRLVGCAGAALAGLLPVPLALTALFAARGALAPYLYGTVFHNVTPGIGDWGHAAHRGLLLLVLVPVLYGAARGIARRAPRPVATRRAFVFLAAGLYAAGLYTLWPLRTREDLLPLCPLLALLATPLVLDLTDRVPWTRWRPLVPRAVGTLGVCALIVVAKPWQGGPLAETRLLGDVLRLTRPGEPVMDLKGESVFRPRPFYYVIESITKQRFRAGLLADDIPERLVATGTTVAVTDLGGFPPRARTFLSRNYVPVGPLRVAGRRLAGAATPGTPLPFDLGIATRYAVVTDGPAAAGSLDGTPYDGPRFLAAGHHEYVPAAGGRLAILWERAATLGFTPFRAHG